MRSVGVWAHSSARTPATRPFCAETEGCETEECETEGCETEECETEGCGVQGGWVQCLKVMGVDTSQGT